MSDIIQEALDGGRGESAKLIAETGLEWLELLLRKNADYGSSVWDSPALCPAMPAKESILVRMSDKIARIKSIQESGRTEVSSESFEDTITDLGAYCLLYVAAPNKTTTN